MKTLAIVERETADFPREAILTIREVARGLGVSVRMVERMDVPTIYAGKTKRRYHWGQVLDHLKAQAK